MPDETNTKGGEGEKPPAGAQPPKTGEPAEAEADPMLARLMAAERASEAAKREAEALRAKVKQHEQKSRKAAVLDALYAEFPGLPAADVRGAALIAADDGVIDLAAEDSKPAVGKLKEILAARAKATPKTTTPSLGGTPGAPGAARPSAAKSLPI